MGNRCGERDLRFVDYHVLALNHHEEKGTHRRVKSCTRCSLVPQFVQSSPQLSCSCRPPAVSCECRGPSRLCGRNHQTMALCVLSSCLSGPHLTSSVHISLLHVRISQQTLGQRETLFLLDLQWKKENSANTMRFMFVHL